MSEEDVSGSGVLPTGSVTKEQRVVLVESLLVDWRVLEHLHGKGIMEERFLRATADGCCKPDGGTCCVNARPSIRAES
jgi:hypothetical protein